MSTSLVVRARATARLWCVSLHILRGVATVAFVYPRIDTARRLALKQAWSGRLLEILGISLNYAGQVPRTGLLVSNHISFVDVFAINALVPSSFVAKDDVKAWPVIGWLTQHTDTLFLERGSRAAAHRAREDMMRHLQAGARVAVFPEGTTSNGEGVLPFHSAMFQAAIDAKVDVAPIVLTYVDDNGLRSHAADFVGETSLVQCLWSIACASRLTVRVNFLPAHAAVEADRRHLSAHVHRQIAHHLTPLP